MAETKQAQPGQVQSLIKALRLLNLLADSPSGLSLKQVSEKSGYPASTTHRLLSTLQQEHFVRFDKDALSWSIGVQAFSVGAAFVADRDLVAAAKPGMAVLMEHSGETANLSILDGANIVYLAQVASRHMMRANATLGHRVPLHSTAAGKAMLAWLPDKQRQSFVARLPFNALTPHTITSAAAFHQALAQARSLGYALDMQEHTLGLACIAAPIFDEEAQAIAAVSVSGPLQRMQDQLDAGLADFIVSLAAEITTAFGGRPQNSPAP